MRRRKILSAIACLLAFATTGCEITQPVTLGDLLNAENMSEFNRRAMGAKSQGYEGIPLFLAVIDDSLKTKYDTFSYGKLNASITHLHDLAISKTYSLQSVPVLVHAIREQVAITDTLLTAETLKIITGVDVGYDAEFISNYDIENEDRRMEMIAVWQKWYVENSG